MRRIFHNSTAIALCLSMGLPQLAAAEAVPNAGEAGRTGNIRLAQAEDAPVILPQPIPPAPGAAATDEAAGGEDAARTGADQPAPTAETDQSALPPSNTAEAAQDKGDSGAPQDSAGMGAAPADTPTHADIAKALAEREAAEADAAAPPAAGAATEVATQPDTTAAEPAPGEPEATGQPAAEGKAPEAPAAAPEAPGGADTAAPVPARSDEIPPALPESDAAKAEAAPAVTPEGASSDADIAKALAEREAAGASDTDAARTGAAAAPAVLPKAAGKADKADKAPKAEAATPAAGKDAVTAPEVAQPSSGDDLAAALAAAQAVPEASAPETAAAREAAQEASAPPVAALAQSSDPVVATETTKVTEENSRSATEDFLTDLKGALRQGGAVPVVGGQAQQEQAQDGQATVTPAPTDTAGDKAESRKRDRTDDLLGVALPALAGLIAGQMLSNNRQVTLNTGDRVVVTRPDGSQEIIKDDNALLQRPGSTVQTQEFADGSSRTVVAREDGSQVVTIRDRDLRVLRRTLVNPDGTTVALIDDTAQVQPVVVSQLPPPAKPVTVAPGQRLNEADLRDALRREVEVNRAFTLGQIRNIPEVRALVAPIDIQAITFDTGSAAIKPDQAQNLATLGRVISEFVRSNPREVFMVEGYTDTVGSDAANLALSDRRAESVALALTEFFGVPPENMVVQGYGEQFLKVPAEGDIRANRRAAVRRITDLLARS